MTSYPTITINGKQERTHRHIMGRHIGRELKTTELVHHANGDVFDNRIENLRIVSRSEHMKIHPEIGAATRFKRTHSIRYSRLNRLYIDFGMSIREIADHIGVSAMTIHRNLKEHGISRRNKSDAAKLKAI